MFDTAVLETQVQALFADACAREGATSDWVELVARCQSVVNQLHAVQTVALARLAATVTVEEEDGTLGSRMGTLGDHRLDAGSLVCDVLGVTASAAEDRVHHAIRLVTLLPEVLRAQATGVVDEWRARVVSSELDDAEADASVCRVVSAALGSSWDEAGVATGVRLRRQVRSVLHEVAPLLLEAACERARVERAMSRWAAAPGVDEWRVRLPAEVAAEAFAAVDALAQRLRRQGDADTIAQARADALVQLIKGQSSCTYTVLVATSEPVDPAAATRAVPPPRTAAQRLARRPALSVTGLHSSETTVVPGAWLREVLGTPGTVVKTAQCHPATGALLAAPGSTPGCEPGGPPPGSTRGAEPGGPPGAYRPSAALIAFVKARDGCCRHPGCTVHARFCDVDHVVPWPHGPTRADNLICLCRRHHRVKQLLGWAVRLRPDGTVLWRDAAGRRRASLPVDHSGATRGAARTAPAGVAGSTAAVGWTPASGSTPALAWTPTSGSTPGFCSTPAMGLDLPPALVEAAAPTRPTTPAPMGAVDEVPFDEGRARLEHALLGRGLSFTLRRHPVPAGRRPLPDSVCVTWADIPAAPTPSSTPPWAPPGPPLWAPPSVAPPVRLQVAADVARHCALGDPPPF